MNQSSHDHTCRLLLKYLQSRYSSGITATSNRCRVISFLSVGLCNVYRKEVRSCGFSIPSSHLLSSLKGCICYSRVCLDLFVAGYTRGWVGPGRLLGS